ncbi:asparagine--tRNA ligase [bacterium]|nr:asparagine--tRNA ligase [bacterium]
MDRFFIVDAVKHEGETVEIKGWLYNRRGSGKIQFLIIRDGTGIIQCIVEKKNFDEELFEKLKNLNYESSIIVKGKLRADARAPGGFELDVDSITIVHESEPYPITPKEHGTGFLMDHRHLWLRSSKQHAILKIRDTAIKAWRDFFDEEGFTMVDAPIFTGTSVEGTTTLFETEYFGQKANLSQSGQLHMEAAAMALGKVYCFGPTFRAEKSKTRRHVTEFWMLEPEVAYADLDDVIALAERMLIYSIHRILEKNRRELEILERDTKILENVKAPFPRMSYTEAVDYLNAHNYPFDWGSGDFGGDEETILGSIHEQPLVIHRYPGKARAFYMKPDPENPEVVLNFDLLAPEGYGEIIGGSQRVDDLDTLLAKMEEQKLPRTPLEWYIDLRKYGSVPHSGYGIGLDRFLTWVCKRSHIRESIPFPRLMHRLHP